MHDHVGNEFGEDVFEKLRCKVERGPVVTILQDIQDIAYTDISTYLSDISE